MCCIGGGPGSDIIGLIIFLRSINRQNVQLKCDVLDKFPQWHNIWKSIARHLPMSCETSYRYLDLTSVDPLERDWFGLLKIRNADIITMVKAFSPVAAYLNLQRSALLRHQMSTKSGISAILSHAKPGALVIYIDNYNGQQNQIFKDIAQAKGLQLLVDHWWVCDIRANMSDYNATWGSFGFQACPSCKLQGYVYWKPRVRYFP